MTTPTTRRYVLAWDVNIGTVQARRTLEDWATYLSENSLRQISTWDDVYETLLWEFIAGGEYCEFVSEADPS